MGLVAPFAGVGLNALILGDGLAWPLNLSYRSFYSASCSDGTPALTLGYDIPSRRHESTVMAVATALLWHMGYLDWV